MNKNFLIEGRSVRVSSEKNPDLGWCGEINPQVLVNFGLEYPAAAFEIYL